MAKQSYVVMNLNDGTSFWVEDARSPEAAIEEYVSECFQEVQEENALELQAVAVKSFKDFKIKLSWPPKIEHVKDPE